MERPRSDLALPESGSRSLVLAWTVFVLVLAASYVRLFFGVNFGDEAFYIAIPLRFVLGDLPFRDDSTTLFSMFSFVSYPFFKLYHGMAGSEGIVLFARHLYLAYMLALAALIYRCLRAVTGPALGLLVAACALAFVPFNLQGLSYNTLGCGLFSAGLFAGLRGCRDGLSRYLGLSGFLLALAIACYPPMLIAVAGALCCLLAQYRRGLAPLFLGGLCAVLCLAPFLAHASRDTVLANIAYVRSVGVQGGGWGKLVTALQDGLFRLRVGLLLAVPLCALLVFRRRRGWAWLGVLVPLVLWYGNRFPKGFNAMTGHGFVLGLGLIGPLLLPFVKDPARRRLFLTLWLPSALAALVISYSSSNGYLNAGLGFVPGALATLLLLFWLVTGAEAAPGSPGATGGLRPAPGLALFAVSAFILLWYQYQAVYWDAGLTKLTSTVGSGPYRYLRTTVDKAIFVEGLGNDVRRVAHQSKSVVFYYNFPAGYLLSDLRPAANAVWLFSTRLYPGLDTSQLEQRYREPGGRPDAIVRLERLPWGDGPPMVLERLDDHPVERLLASGQYRPVAAGEGYRLYLRQQQQPAAQGRTQ